MTKKTIEKAFHIGAILFVINAIITIHGWEAIFAAMYIVHKCLTYGVDYVGFISPGDVNPENDPRCPHGDYHDKCPDCRH